MSHEIDMSNNRSNMFYVGEKPWHSLGKEFLAGTVLTAEEAIKAAGLDWEVGLCDLQTTEVKEGEKVLVPAGTLVDTKGVYRSDTGAIIGNVGPRTTLLQNSKAFSWFNPFLEDKTVSFETAGSLRGGARIWVLAKISGDNLEVVKNDAISRFLLLSNSHDGSMSVRVGFTPIRIVCQNTLSAAIGNKSSKLIRLRHSSKVEENLEEVRDIINMANQSFEATVEQYRTLARKQINSSDLRKYVKVVMVGKDIKDDDLSTRMKNTIDEIIGLCESGKGNTMPGVRGTYWSAMNGVAEYLSYNAGRGAATRMDSLWFGPNQKVNEVALETALQMAT